MRSCGHLQTDIRSSMSPQRMRAMRRSLKISSLIMRDIAPVAGIIRVPNLVSVNLSLPVKTIPQLIAYAKANPGKLNFGAPKGGTVQLSGELFKMMSGVNIVHVACSNQMQAVTDLFVDRIQVSSMSCQRPSNTPGPASYARWR